jgi:CRP-like cAMP-binding protein
MSMIPILDLIRRVPLFSLLSPEMAQSVASRVTKRRFRAGEVIVTQGQQSEGLFILLNGRVRVLTTDERGKEVILAVLKAGAFVGEMSLIDRQPASATVRAELQTDTLLLDRAEFERSLPGADSLSYTIMRGLVRRLRLADRRIEMMALLGVHGRVEQTLRDMAEESDGDLVITHRVNRQDVAKIVGASREMVSRVMRDLEDSGAIVTRPDGSVLLQPRPAATQRG